MAKNDTLRDSLEDAFEEVQEAEDEQDLGLEGGEVEEAEEADFEEIDGDVDDDEGADVDDDEGADDEEADEDTDTDTDEATDEDTDDDSDDTDGDSGGDESPAPVSWTESGKKAWDKLPQEAKAEVYRREAQINNVLRESAADRQFVDQYLGVMQPYMPLMQQFGAAPLQVIDNFMQTGAVLRTGSPQDKAAMVAQIVNDYDIDIETLDNAISGRIQERQRTGFDPRRVEEVIQRTMGQYMPQGQPQAAPQGGTAPVNVPQEGELEAFAAEAPFYTEVREQMADFFDYAEANRQRMTLQQAYDMALAMRPDLRKAQQQQEAAGNAKANKRRLAKKRRAGKSLRGSSGSNAPRGKKGRTLRDDILSAMDEVDD